MNEISVLDRIRSVSTDKWIPLQASLELTYRCNERCTHCYVEKFWDDPGKVLTIEQWSRVLSELRSAGTLYIILMGGEAMISPLFWQILKMSVEMGFHTSMISNGQKLADRATAQKLADHGCAQVTISLYSVYPEIHDGMTRVKGSHEKTIQAIENCLASGIDIGVNCLLTQENINGVFELEKWCMDRNVQMKVDPMVTPKLNGDITPTFLRASYSQLEWFYRERARRWPKSTPKASQETATSYVCNAAKGKCAVNPYGELLPCIEIRESLGNLTTQSFTDIWMSETADRWRKLLVKDLKDYPLSADGSFCDHCPGMAKNEDKDPHQVSHYARKLAEIKRAVNREIAAQAQSQNKLDVAST